MPAKKPGAPVGNQNSALPEDERRTAQLVVRLLPEQKVSYVRAAQRRARRTLKDSPKLASWVTDTLDKEAMRELRRKAPIPLAPDAEIFDE